MPRVLIADEETLNRFCIRQMLSVIPTFSFREVSDGIAAVEYARRHQPMLMILNFRLPKQNGFEVCRTIKLAPGLSTISVILITHCCNPGDKVIAKLAKADGFLTQPFEETELLSVVLHALQCCAAH